MTRYRTDKRGPALLLRGTVSRLAQSLSRSSTIDSLLEPEDPPESGPAVSEEAIARAIEAWRARASYLPGEVLADPAWGMLLELLQAEVQDRRVSLARLCKVSGAPAAAAVRWLNALERHGLAVRRADREQPEHEFVSLSRTGSAALRHYFDQVVQSHRPPEEHWGGHGAQTDW